MKKPTALGMSDVQMEKYCQEAMDPQKVQLHCGRHSYIGSDTPPPPRGCKNCWEAYWWFKIASTPPHLRAQRLEEALKMVRDAVQAVEVGDWDFQVAEGYPEATIEKDGFDDITRDYRKKKVVLA